MDPAQKGNSHNPEIEEEPSFRIPNSSQTLTEINQAPETNGPTLSDFIPIYVPTIENGLIPQTPQHEPRFLDFLRARPTNDWFLNFGFKAKRFRVPFVRKIKWKTISQSLKKQLKSPYNIALLIWTILCAIGIIFLLMLMCGLLNGALKSHKRRDRWEEVTNQILNALFTIMCVYQYPTITHHLILVLRWRPNDQVEARGLYSRKGLKRKHERAHMGFVVFLLHLTCMDQFMYCALFWGWSKDDRPEWPQYLLLGVGVVAPVLAAWYTFYGPLGKKGPDENSAEHERTDSTITTTTTTAVYDERRIVVTSPEWVGGTFDCCDDVTVGCLSCFCMFCVFGWNMERLGLGNMYVHIFTFVAIFLSPLWVFAITALNIDDDTIKIVVAGSGVVVCFLGLFYGGYWRSKMRHKFKLPGNNICCGKPLVTDFIQWLFCWSCSLAQEVRTGNFYDIEDGNFCMRVVDGEGRSVVVPLPNEGALKGYRSFSCPPVPKVDGAGADGGFELVAVIGRANTYSKVYDMKPPKPSLMGNI